jgi:hypothetical protein
MVVADKKGMPRLVAVRLTRIWLYPQFATSVGSYVRFLQSLAGDSLELNFEFKSNLKVKCTLLLCQSAYLEAK